MENKNKLILKAIEKYYKEGDFKKINHLVSDIHPNLFYDYFIKHTNWKEEDYIIFLENLKAEYASKLFSNFSKNYQLNLIDVLSDDTLKKIFSEYYIDEAVDLLEEYPYEKTRYIINLLEEKEAKKIIDIFKYKKYQIGFHMVVDFVAIKQNLTIKEAKNDIKNKVKKSLEIIGNIFVLDDEEKLVGYITPDSIIVEANDKKVSDFLMPIDFIYPIDKINKAEKILAKFDVPSVPVVDQEQKIVGVIEAEDVIEMYDEIDDAFFEVPKEKYGSKAYFDLKIIDLFKSRIVWLLVLLFIGILSQVIVMEFQNIWEANGIYGSTSSDATAVIISQIVTLALFTALSASSSINDSAGNSGSQTSSTIIRSIAIGEIEEKDFGRAIWKETKVAFYLGLAMLVASFFRIFFVWWVVGSLRDIPSEAAELGWNEGKVWSWYIIIALIASVTFFLAILIGNLIGVLLPIIAYKFNSDGTLISGPLQTTVVDIVVVTLYLGLTTAIFVPLSQSGYFDVDTTTNVVSNFSSISNFGQFISFQI